MNDKIIQIGKILNLSSTKSRDNTITSLVESILYSYNESLGLIEILDFIKDIFNIEPFETEVSDAIQTAIESGDIISSQGKFSLCDDKYIEIQKKDSLAKSVESERIARFQVLVNKYPSIKEEEVPYLWKIFNEYIYECFYHYGENAVNYFRPLNTSLGEENLAEENSFKNTLNRILSKRLKDIFKIIVITFSKEITHKDIEYLESLSKKTIAFHSLGLPKELHTEITDLGIIDWTIFVDTNFLFSILKLHKHPENNACEALLSLVEKAGLKINFKFTPFTLAELKHKKIDFENTIPKLTLSKSHVNALLKSDKLDSFSEAYYESLLNDSESTLHPSEVIEVAERTLTKIKDIALYNSKFERLTDDYLKNEVQEYEIYISIINQARREKNIERDIFKPYKQIYHDVFLREAILYLQSLKSDKSPESISEVNYIGITLDKLLIKYDRYKLSKSGSPFLIPNFYTPSFLLSKLYRLLPVQTDDYKRAFITAIATFSFSESLEKSKSVQRFVNYFRSQGLDDEKLLLSFITDDFFLNKFFDEETDQDSFFESEVNNKFKSLQSQVDLINHTLEVEKAKSVSSQEEKKRKQYKIEEQESLITEYKEKEKVLTSSLKRLNQKKEGNDFNTNQLNLLGVIEENIKDKEISSLKEEIIKKENEINNQKRKIERDLFINKQLSKWRLMDWIFLIIYLIVAFIINIYYLNQNNFDLKASLLMILSDYKSNPIISVFMTIFVAIFNIYIFRSLYDKYKNHSNIKSYIEKIDIPDSMKPF